MKVTVAGEKKEIEQGTTIAKLIVDEKVENPEYVTVTVNDEFVEAACSRAWKAQAEFSVI